jgi:hypothetical protein
VQGVRSVASLTTKLVFSTESKIRSAAKISASSRASEGMAYRAIVGIALALFCSLQPACGLYGPSSDVVTLTPDNFKNKVLKSDSVVLVEFFAPW